MWCVGGRGLIQNGGHSILSNEELQLVLAMKRLFSTNLGVLVTFMLLLIQPVGNLSVCLSVCLSVFLSVCLSVYRVTATTW